MSDSEMREISWIDQVGQSKLNAAVEMEEMALFNILKPSIYQDGNQWCVLFGVDIQSGICGFGDTPRKAVLDFNKSWDRSVK